MPGTEVVPEGPHRVLLADLFGLYRRAGTPGVRTIAAWVAQTAGQGGSQGRAGSLRRGGGLDAISHSTIAKIFNGTQRPATTRQLILLVRALAEHGQDATPPDSDLITRFTQLWVAMQDQPPGASAQQPRATPASPESAPDRAEAPEPILRQAVPAQRRPDPGQQDSGGGPELRALLTYLLWTLAKRADIATVYRRIIAERDATGDPRLGTYEKLQTFREKWQDAWQAGVVPPWDRLVQPWALALGGEPGLAEAERRYDAIGAAEANSVVPEPSREPGSLTGNLDLDEYLTQILGTVSMVADRGNDLFVDAVLPRLRELAREIRPWRDGTVSAMDSNYETMLVRAYERATTVKAATIPAFMPLWEQSFGAQLTAAHLASGAATTRVFVFDSLDDALQPQVRHALFAQVLMRAAVYVFARDEAPRVAPPRSRSWDFAVIDEGAIIAETIIEADRVGATWYFGNADAVADYLEFFERLIVHSIEYGRLLRQRPEAGRDLPGLVTDLAALLRAYGETDRERTVRAMLRTLQDGDGGRVRRAEDLRRILALFTEDGTLPGGLPAFGEAVSAESSYSYLRGYIQQVARAALITDRPGPA